MQKKINVILVMFLMIVYVANIIIGDSSPTMIYSTDTKLDKITYLGKELLSEDFIKDIISSKEIGKSLITLNNSSKDNSIGIDEEGFEKSKELLGFTNTSSYTGLKNLIFNLSFMGIEACEEKFGLVLNENSLDTIVRAYLINDNENLKEAADAIASGSKCPGYQATITNFDLSMPVHSDDNLNYYGPFKFSDNTMGFAEVICSTGSNVYKSNTKNSYTTVKYVDNENEYYLGISKEVTDIKIDFEGVFFVPEIKFFNNSLAPYGCLKNSTTSFQFTVKSSEASDISIVEENKSNKNEITLQVSNENEEIPETIIIYNSEKQVDTVIQKNDSAKISVPLEDGTYYVESIYSDGTSANGEVPEEFTVTEGIVNATNVNYIVNIGLYDLDKKTSVTGYGYLYDGDGKYIQQVEFYESFTQLFLAPGDYKLVTIDINSKYNVPEEYKFTVDNGNIIVKIPVTEGKASSYIVVKDTAGFPVEGVKVILDNNQNNDLSYTTNTNGEIEIDKLTIGAHSLTITEVPENYILPTETVYLNVKSSEEMVKETIILSKIKFNLRVTKNVEGSTTEVSDAVYNVKQLEAPYYNKVLSVSEFPVELEIGSYSITEIIPGKGYNFSDEVSKEIEVGDTGSTTVKFTTSAQTGTITIRNYSVNGYNDTIEGISYKLYNLDSEIVAEAISDSNGNVLFEKLPLGTYTLQQEAVPEGYIGYKKLVSVKIEKAGEVVSYDSISAMNVGSITVYHDSATAGVPYYLYNESNKLINVLYTDTDGIAVFKELLPGKYTLKTLEESTKNPITPTKIAKILHLLEPIVAKAYSGEVIISLDNLNVVVGSELGSNVKTTSLGTSSIVLSSNATNYDESSAGMKDLGNLNVDNISTIISQTAASVDYSNDILEITTENIVESGKTQNIPEIVGNTYDSDTGTIVLSENNKTLGDADFSLTATDVSDLLNQSVKLPKTGTSNYYKYIIVLISVCLILNNIPMRKKALS